MNVFVVIGILATTAVYSCFGSPLLVPVPVNPDIAFSEDAPKTGTCVAVDGKRVVFDSHCFGAQPPNGCNAGDQAQGCRFCGEPGYEDCDHVEIIHVEVNSTDRIDPFPLNDTETNIFEGDMLLINQTHAEFLAKYQIANDQIREIIAGGASDSIGVVLYNALRDRTKLWERGIIPYVISSTFNSDELDTIKDAFAEIMKWTCVKIVPRYDQRDYVSIIRGGGCYSSVGRTGGVQALSLGDGCVWKGIAMHEMMHAIGFYHEQSRDDRDSYVQILYQNIQQGQAYNFQKFTLQEIDHLGEPYDYSSIMHYDSNAFSKDGVSPTIMPLRSGVKLLNGYLKRIPSQVDINKINKLYGCSTVVLPPPVPTTTTTVRTTYGPVPNDQCKDFNPYCESWSRSNNCALNPEYMIYACPKSCNTCDRYGYFCEDKHRYCADWAKNNDCYKTPEYMRVVCPVSCRICTPGQRSYVPKVMHAEAPLLAS